MSCSYTGYHFGAPYPDATCCDGYLWDLDSCDDDNMLTSGGDTPCPSCNLVKWLEYLIEDLNTGFSGTIDPDNQAYHMLTRAIFNLKDIHSLTDIAKALNTITLTLPYWSSTSDLNDFPDMDISWPWPLTSVKLTSHEKITLCSKAKPAEGFTLKNNLWLKKNLNSHL